jgi:hypothetical protein
MDTKGKQWLAEIDRRATIYDNLPDGGTGRLGALDYLAMIALIGGLTVVFWTWAV